MSQKINIYIDCEKVIAKCLLQLKIQLNGLTDFSVLFKPIILLK